jgi:DNA-directed RNA polymerase specialized sigma24 family protein
MEGLAIVNKELFIGLCMTPSEPITPWLSSLRRGNPAAAQRIWDRYFTRLVVLARKKLRGRRLGVADEEDVAISAMDTLCRNAREGHFPQLADSDGLWRLLVVITARTAMHVLRDERRRKRDPRGAQTAITGRNNRGDLPDCQTMIEEFVGNEPTPQFAAQVSEEYQRLLKLLDAEQQAIAISKLEGLTNADIAVRINRSLRTVERKLGLIRSIWLQEPAMTEPEPPKGKQGGA